ncbi:MULTISPECIES: sensor domain-containing phosphodiesterase [unclassified Vibrio]|nr:MULTISPECIES: EAL domain-containing protein [unclassified Vibrio]NAW58065.1 EAL domain-containing protein [Vibrio sp. V36_P2S2PM302]NAX26313.1 EAL domain-containing protein [Vibrio sp. V38_P2S17PM301]NAX30258.1 EAL domain-containing protein [Vibrio sp. V37_P2S8PM304]
MAQMGQYPNSTQALWSVDLESKQVLVHDALHERTLIKSGALRDVLKPMSKRTRRSFYDFLKICIAQDKMYVTSILYSTKGLLSKVIRVSGSKVADDVISGNLEVISELPKMMHTYRSIDSILDDDRKSVVIVDEDFDVLFVNQTFLNCFGLSASQCIGKPLTDSSSGMANEVFLQRLKAALKHSDRWVGRIENQTRQGEFMMQELDVKRVSMSSTHSVLIVRFFNLEGVHNELGNVEPDFTMQDIAIPDEHEFRRLASEYVLDNQYYVCLCIRPDFSQMSREMMSSRLAIGLKNIPQDLLLGYAPGGVFYLLFDVHLDNLKEASGLSRSIRTFKRALKRCIDDSVYRDVRNGHFGVDIFGLDETPIEKIISHAEKAMVTHDRRVTNVNFYDEQLYRRAIYVRNLEQTVIEAIRARSLKVHYQPIVNLKTGRIDKVEALCRFEEMKGDYSIQELIRTAEELGLVHTLDKIITEKAVKEFSEFYLKSPEPIELSVNCSLADQEHGLNYLADLHRLIELKREKGMPVTIEITESAYFDGSLGNSELINTIRRSGIHIAVDDFGTGSSSFAYFNDFSFDVLKIDRKFISELHLIKQKFYAVKMLTELSHALGIKVVAEGVESKEELDLLRTIDVDYVQGFYFCRPVGKESLIAVNDVNELLIHRAD